jgi:RNA polymerase sigma factor (TIGR02999 family)
MQAKQARVPGDVTRLLAAARAGESEALDRLMPLVYDELRGLARHRLGRERAAHTLRATELVHEAYLKLAGGGAAAASDRAHFLAIASRAMRQVLVDHARRRQAAKRGGEWERTTLGGGNDAMEVRPDEVLALDEALEELEPRQRQVVEYRFFGGMEEQEIAALLDVSERTVRRDWVKARAWLYRTLYGESARGERHTEGPPTA